MKRVALSYWTAGVLGVILLALHVLWLMNGGAGGEVVSGFGAVLVVLGLFVAARPFIRAGVAKTAERQVAPPELGATFNSPGKMDRAWADHRDRVSAEKPNVIAERIVAVVVVMIGTVLNGYSAPIARLLHLKV